MVFGDFNRYLFWSMCCNEGYVVSSLLKPYGHQVDFGFATQIRIWQIFSVEGSHPLLMFYEFCSLLLFLPKL